MGESSTRAAAAAALAIVSGSTAANASQTVVDLPVSQILSNGASVNGTFDISSLLHNSSGNFAVTAATLQLSGYSPFGQTGTAFAGYVYEYTATGVTQSCGWWGFCYSYFYSYPVYGPSYVGVDQMVDTLSLSSGSELGVGSDFPTGSPQSFYGSLVAQLSLGATEVTDANSTGSISFTGTAQTNTDVQLNGASLTLDLAPIEAQISAVPEPETWAMMILGFGTAGAALRRNRRRTSRVAIA